MSTKFFCDLCNAELASVPPKQVKGFAVPGGIEFIVPGKAQPQAPIRVDVTFQSVDLCDNCKTRLMGKLMTEAAYTKAVSPTFGGAR